jgi:hypothetical protein
MRMSVIQDYTITQGTYPSPVTGSQPQVLAVGRKINCRIALGKAYINTYALKPFVPIIIVNYLARSNHVNVHYVDDSPQPGLLPLVISLNANEKTGL